MRETITCFSFLDYPLLILTVPDVRKFKICNTDEKMVKFEPERASNQELKEVIIFRPDDQALYRDIEIIRLHTALANDQHYISKAGAGI